MCEWKRMIFNPLLPETILVILMKIWKEMNVNELKTKLGYVFAKKEMNSFFACLNENLMR